MKHAFQALLVAIVSAAPILADATALELAVQESIKKAEPSIACLLISRATARAVDMSQPEYVPDSYGSGIVIDKSGLILTCAHVVRGEPRIYVRLPGGIRGYASVHALDSRSDLAVVQLLGVRQELRPVTFGDGGAVKKGQFVVAMSNPFAAGFRDGEPSASAGIVSNLRRRLVNLPAEKDRRKLCLHHFGVLLQTDARMNLGCSGGALVNLKGEVIGLITAQAALLGLETPGGFALPMNAGLQRIVEVLKKGEEVEYGFLGVTFRDVEGRGVQIDEVIGRSPARQAGLRENDYLVSVDGMPVRTSDDVFLTIGTVLAGNTVEVERSATGLVPGQKVRVTLAKYYVPLPSIASKRPRLMAGLRVDYTSLAVQRGAVTFASIPEGVLIRDVETGSPADKAKLQADKIITHVNGIKVTQPSEFYREMASARRKVELTLFRHDGAPDRLTLELE